MELVTVTYFSLAQPLMKLPHSFFFSLYLLQTKGYFGIPDNTYIPWLQWFTIETGCEISHEDTNKCSNNETKTSQKQNGGTIDKYVFKIS
jgi:hypothetical protein